MLHARKWRRITAVARKEFLHVFRDFRSLLMALATPLLLLTLFGYALTLDVDNVPLAVWDQSNSSRSRDFIARFQASPYFSLRFRSENYAQLEEAINTGRVLMGLIVPRDFAQRLEAGRNAPVQVLVDGTDSNTATIGIGYAEAIAQLFALELNLEHGYQNGERAAKVPLDVRSRVWYNEELESRNFIIPGLIAVIMMVIAALLTSLTIAREWEQGTMEQLLAAPLRPGELIAGKLVPYFVIGMCDVLLTVLMAKFVFNVPLRGNVGLLFAASAIFLTGALGMGMTISIVTRSQLLSSQVAVVATFLPAFLLSGFVFPIVIMPKAIQLVTYFVPARYFVAILKGIYLKGIGLEIIGGQVLLLVVYAVAMLALARWKFRGKLA